MKGVWILPKRTEQKDLRMTGRPSCQLGSLLWLRQEEERRGGEPTWLHKGEVPYLLLPPWGQARVCTHACACVRVCVCACAPALRPQAGEGTLNQNLARPTGTSPLLPASFEGHSRWPLAGGGQGRNSWRGINLFFATAPHKPIRADPTGALVLGEENTRRVNLGMLILAGTFQLPAG